MNPFATLVAQVTKSKPKKVPPLEFEVTTIFRPGKSATKALRILIDHDGPMSASDLAARTGLHRNSLRSCLLSCEKAGVVLREVVEGRTIYRMIK